MKKLLLAGAFAFAATTATAGSLGDPVVTPTVTYDTVATDAVDSAGSDEWVGVLLTFLTIVVLGVGG